MIRREDKRRPSAVARVDLEQAQKCKTSMALSRCSITSRTSSGGKLSSAAGRAIPIGLPKSSSNSSSMQHRQAVGTTGTGCRGGIVSVGLCMFVLGPMRTSNGATLQGDRVLTLPTSVMDVRLKKTHINSLQAPAARVSGKKFSGLRSPLFPLGTLPTSPCP